MLDAEVLILGLVLFCVEGDFQGGGCDIPGNPDLPARAYLVNATEKGMDCNSGGCQACNHTIGLHLPVLLFDKEQFEVGGLGEEDECSLPLPDALRCWNVTNTELCVDPGSTSETFSTEDGRPKNAKKPGIFNDNDAFGWIGSISYFQKGDSLPEFLGANDLLPGDGKSVVATLDFPDTGELRSARHGKGWKGLGKDYTLWKPSHGGNPQPEHTSLADAVVWELDNVGDFEIYNCDDRNEFLKFDGSSKKPRIILANLPRGAWGRGSGPGMDWLYHYLMYFNLFQDGAMYCGYPEVDGDTPSTLESFDFLKWLRSGKLQPFRGWAEDAPVAADNEGATGAFDMRAFNAESSLCPPTKFP